MLMHEKTCVIPLLELDLICSILMAISNEISEKVNFNKKKIADDKKSIIIQQAESLFIS